MKTVLISPYSQRLKTNKENPKNYPFWADVVKKLKDQGINIIQIGIMGEPKIEGCHHLTNLKMSDLQTLLTVADAWASVDNFFHHFAAYYKKPGVVIFGKSDPNIFGHPENTNLLKGRQYLRHQQFGFWDDEQFDPVVFVPAEAVVEAILQRLNRGNAA